MAEAVSTKYVNLDSKGKREVMRTLRDSTGDGFRACALLNIRLDCVISDGQEPELVTRGMVNKLTVIVGAYRSGDLGVEGITTFLNGILSFATTGGGV